MRLIQALVTIIPKLFNKMTDVLEDTVYWGKWEQSVALLNLLFIAFIGMFVGLTIV